MAGQSSEFISVRAAASDLGVSEQTVRNKLNDGTLKGSRRGRAWQVEAKSVKAYLAKFGRKETSADTLGALSSEVERLRDVVERLEQRDQGSGGRLEAMTLERDRYRAEASTMRTAAIQLNAAARDVHGAVGQLVDVLERQSDALSELLGPASPRDLISR